MAWLILTLKRECWRRRRDAHLDRYVGQEAERGGEELGTVLELLPSPVSGPEELVLQREDTKVNRALTTARATLRELAVA